MLFVEGAVLGLTKRERCNIAAEVLAASAKYGISSSFIALDCVFGRTCQPTDSRNLHTSTSDHQM